MKQQSRIQRDGSPMQLVFPFRDERREVPTTPVPPPTGETQSGPHRRSRTHLLQSAIREALGPNTRVILTDARRVLLSQSIRGGIRTVRAHQLFLDAPADVRRAVGTFLQDGNPQAGRVIDEFIDHQDHLLRFHAPPQDRGTAVGQFHDLQSVQLRLNRQYFDGQIEAQIRWGRTGTAKRRRKRSITLGSFCYRSRCITIHPALDQVFVPGVIVERVVHHELCHAFYPAEKSASGRRVLHGPAFRRAEALFEHATEADLWIQHNLDRLLRYAPRMCKSE